MNAGRNANHASDRDGDGRNHSGPFRTGTGHVVRGPASRKTVKESTVTTDESPIEIVLVEDNDSFREVLAEELGLTGFHVHPVPDAESALLEVDNRRFDVAIVDLNLPGISGAELI